MTLRFLARLLTGSWVGLVGFVACGGSKAAPASETADDAGAASDDASPADDSATPDAAPDVASLDGTPMRIACTEALGNGLTTAFGRLDGLLVSIVHVDTRGCNADSSHVHLQVLAKNQTYDIAVNVDGLFYQQDITLADAWSEGWHAGITNSYAAMGVHNASFATTTIHALATTVDDALATANHVSVFATGYGVDGAHLVHFHAHNDDGMVVVNPLGPTPHALMFAFQGDTF